MFNKNWQVWVHKRTQQVVFAAPTPVGATIWSQGGSWIDAVLFYESGAVDSTPVRVMSYTAFRENYDFAEALTPEQLKQAALEFKRDKAKGGADAGTRS